MIEIVSYNPTDGSSCKKAHFDVRVSQLPTCGLYVVRMAEFVKNGQSWVTVPQAGVKDANNPDKYNYFSIFTFDEPYQQKFVEQCKNSLKEYKEKMYNTRGEGVASGGFPA